MAELGYIHLSDGHIFSGNLLNWNNHFVTGEVVFNTSMAGYVESLTDPSYSNQILVFTYPLIGNYGVQIKDFESSKIQVKGVILSQISLHPSHEDSTVNLRQWLKSQNIPILYNIDTRALTLHLRSKGVMAGLITNSLNKPTVSQPSHKFISAQKPKIYNPKSKKKIILVDCGVKENIIKSIIKYDAQVIQVPHDYDYTNQPYDGVLLSNGPGDPTSYQATIEITKKALKNNKPIFGICLGSQIMGLSSGAKTYKLRFGHRGQNQPCKVENSDRCYVTSQNHGYALDEKTLPKGWRVLFRNLNDNSIEGIEHQTKPFFSVQFHPEAKPGPTDTAWLFERFVKSL
ncbi:carbamoyl phosphate synthase small subunit [Candidatus Saccharibacteria bacterium RIFCSPHIGHO2_12_FULL_41_12]|nr:MAG: carbamoyl phosphate synthase small subunit [Candidatus Saccharibacteria bacterium RIFCSPHIGHO2_12_FULL_41_12]